MPPTSSISPAGSHPSPTLALLRRELTELGEGMVGRQLHRPLDALELHLVSEDQRVAALGEACRTCLEAIDRLDARILDLERQVAAQADLIRGLMPPGEFVTDEQCARMQTNALIPGPEPAL